MTFACGTHRAFAVERGGVNVIGELTPLSSARWERVRDEISTAQVTVPTSECCDLLGELRTVLHELHVYRNGELVWQGVITRIEYEYEQVQVYAKDMLWVAKRTVLDEGYNYNSPLVGNVIEVMDWLLRHKTYGKYGDPWNMVNHLQPVRHADEPVTHRVANAWQFYVWEDFDKFAEDNGADYTVVNRDIFYFDTHLAWNILPPLDPNFLSEFPRVVEYGNELATRGVVTNGQGQAGVATNGGLAEYGVIDLLISNQQEGTVTPAATPEEVAGWANTAGRNISDRWPAPLAVVVPENSTLMPGSPWEMADLIPGSWYQVNITQLCRDVTGWHRLQHVGVSESAPQGETVQITSVAAPKSMVLG